MKHSWNHILLLVALTQASAAFSDGRRTLTPFCNNLGLLVSSHEVPKIHADDIARREMLIVQAVGAQGLETIGNAVHVPALKRVQSIQEALEIADISASDPKVVAPLNNVLGKLSPSRRWALYLNSGFHSISTYTDPHREMVIKSLEHFPMLGDVNHKTKVLDVGIGNGNLVIAAMLQNPKGVVHGIDIAGAGINVGTLRLNEMADLLQERIGGKQAECIGRFCMTRGSAADPALFVPNSFDAGSMVLTNFAVPAHLRAQALKNIYDSLRPGAHFVFIDPIPRANDTTMGKQFIHQAVENAFYNNTDLTALDIALFSANNAQNLMKIEFLSPAQQTKLVEGAGFKAVGKSEPVFFGFANMQVFQKPLQ